MSNLKRLGFLLVLLSLSFGSAQNNQAINLNYETNNWWGVTSGYINSSYPFGFAFHFGVKNPSGADIRLSGSFQLREGGSSLGLGVDAITPFTRVTPLTLYGGGGGAILFEAESFIFDGHGLVGAEYNFEEADLEEIGVFVEVRLGAALAVGDNIQQPNIPAAAAVVGVNFYF